MPTDSQVPNLRTNVPSTMAVTPRHGGQGSAAGIGTKRQCIQLSLTSLEMGISPWSTVIPLPHPPTQQDRHQAEEGGAIPDEP